jgi:prepilin-type N-terminal cleavage/methylation domain-containing protein
MDDVPRRHRQRAFTLIELLVVVAIIALLIAILLPSLAKARRQAKMIGCRTNLHSIGQACIQYAMDNRDHFADAHATGGQYNTDKDGNITGSRGWWFRVAPGEKYREQGTVKPALPEAYGLPALLSGIVTHDSRPATRGSAYLPSSSGVWVCPDTQEWLRPFKCSYAWQVGEPLRKFTYPNLVRYYTRRGGAQLWLAYDNFKFLPANPSGFRCVDGRTFDPPAYPHLYSVMRFTTTDENGQPVTKYAQASNAVYPDGHVGLSLDN